MSEVPPPKITFPCAYTLRIIGEGGADFRALVVETVCRHAALDEATVSVRESSGGRFHSVTVTIEATGESQLMTIFTELKATGRVQMVL